MFKKILFVCLLFIVNSSESKAQGTAGKEFWLAFMAQDWGCYYNNYYYNSDTPELFLSSQFAAKVTIKAPGQNFSTTITLVPNETRMLRLPREVVCRYSDSVTTNGVEVTADSIINVYAVNRMYWSKGATVVIPTASIVQSPEYFVTTYHDNFTWNWYCNGKQLQSPEFTIVGIADSSVIEIVPTGASSRNSMANVPFQITLKKGQTFQYMTTDWDLTGSVVRSKYISSKFAVFAGNRQSYTNRQSGSSYCNSSYDHIYEQMLPTVTWGNQYTALPFKNNPKGYALKVVAAENNTLVNINGSYVSTLNQGQFYTHQAYTDTLLRISANNRISVAQFALGGYNCNNHPSKPYHGDPAMMMLFPDQQFGQNATVNTVSQTAWWWWNNWWWNQNKPEHYINVMTASSDTASFQINNKKLPASAWKSKSNFSNYHFAQISVDSGSHHLKSSKGFLAYVYGYGVFEGYAFAAAANFKPIQNNFIILNAQCKRDTVRFQAVSNDSFGNYSWKFGDNSTDTGARVKHKYRDTGWYTVKMYCYHKRTNAKDSVTKTLYVADTKIQALFDKDTAICGRVNLVLISKGFNVDNEYRWNDGHPVYYRAVKNPGRIWLEVKERNGCVFRDTFNVSASGFPKASFTVSNDSFCLNRNIDVKFRNLSTSADSVKQYRWDFGDTVVVSSDSVVTHRFRKANTFPVLLRATTKYDCIHDTFMIVDVLPAPKAGFVFTRKDTCFNTNAIELKNTTVINKNEHRRFKWFFSEGFVISNSNPGAPRRYADSGQFKISLIYENTNGCIDTSVQSLKILPNPDAAFTYPLATYCSRDSVPFVSTSYSRFQPLKYRWDWGNGVFSNDSVARHAFSGFGNIPVKLSVWSPGGCKDSVIRTLFVNETPVVDFSINNDTQCIAGHAFSFTNQTRFGGTLNYNWNHGDGNSSSDSNLSGKTYIRDSVYWVRLSTTSNAGCYAERSKPVYLGGYPQVSFSNNQATQCFRGNAFNFTNTSRIQKGQIALYRWKLGNGDSAISRNVSSYRYLTEDSFTVTLVGTSDLGCRDTAAMMVVTHPQGRAEFELNAAEQCFDQHAFAFKNTSTILSGSMAYKWLYGDNTESDSVNGSRRYLNPGPYRVSLISISNQNCRDTIFKPVTVHASPVASFSISKDKQCYRDNRFNFINTSSVSSGTFSSRWDMGDNLTENSKDVLAKHYNSEDTFTVRLIVLSDRLCADTLERMAVTFAQPKAAFAVNDSIQCFKQQNFRFDNQSVIRYGRLAYSWRFGDGSFSADTSPVKTYLKDSVYKVRLISSSEHACSDTITRTLTLHVSPDAVFSIDNDRQCFRGNRFNFTNASSVSKGLIDLYEWQMGDATTFSSADVTAYQYNREDSFNVQLVVRTGQNCFDTSTQMAVTFAQPVARFSVPNDSQCWQKHYFVINNQTQLKYGTLSNAWDFGDQSYSSEYTPSSKSYPNTSASYTIRYKVVSDHGCSDSALKRVSLLERPIANFSINDSIQCFRGHNFSFVNSTGFSAMNTLSYWWDYRNGDTSMGFRPRDAVYNVPGQYPMRLIAYSSLSNCYDTLFKILIPAPHASVAFGIDRDTQCLRFNRFQMNNNSTLQFGSMSQQWLFGDGSRDTLFNPEKSYLSEGAYRIKLLVNTNYGCLDSAERSVWFHPTPKALFTINDDVQCLNKHSFDFSNQSQISRGTYTTSWWFDDQSTDNRVNISGKQFTSADSHKVRLALRSDRGCNDTLFTTVYLENRQNSTITFAENDSQCFRGNRFVFSNFRLNPKATFVSSDWQFGDGQSSFMAQPMPLSFRNDGQFKVRLITLSAAGCLDSTYTDVVVHPHPEVAFRADTVCFPTPSEFINNTGIRTGRIVSWAWTFGDGRFSDEKSPVHRYARAGVYNVALTAQSEYACADTLQTNGAAVVREKPLADFVYTQLPTIEQDQTRLQFANRSSAAATGFKWDFGNMSGSSQRDPIGVFGDTGLFTVSMVAFTRDGCTDTAVRTVGPLMPDFFYFLPNAFSPNDDPHNGLYKGNGSIYVKKFKLEVFNRWGEKLYETDDVNQGWDGTYNGQICMDGTYMCRVQLTTFRGGIKTYEQMFVLMR